MDNQKALTSTAMLASIWEKEKKDTLELILPFVVYSIGKTTSVGGQVEVASVSSSISESFGFLDIPHYVLHKVFIRLAKRGVLKRENHQLLLRDDLTATCRDIDIQQSIIKSQTDEVITALAAYLNYRKEHLFEKDLTMEKTSELFSQFLENRGWLIYTDITKLREVPAHISALHYHISQFILTEYENKSDLFSYTDNIAKGLLLSRIIYGYVDLQYKEKFDDICIYLDTTLLLYIFGFKSVEEKTAASQLMAILQTSGIAVKCFWHNYTEIYGILEAYKRNILNPSRRYGQTLEHFDVQRYSISDMDRVLFTLEDYFNEYNIEITSTPSISRDGSGIITFSDYSAAIGESELKKHLSASLTYRNDDALDNDVASISSIFALRRGKSFKKIESCKALFVTTNRKLAYATRVFVNDTDKSVPLLIDDLELTTILWIKSHKRYSDLPALKLIETARLSIEPTEQIRIEFAKKIEQLKNEPTVTEERAASYRQLIYTAKESIMERIEGNPDNVGNIQLNDLEQLSRQHYNAQLTNENQSLKRNFDEAKRRLLAESHDKVNRSGKCLTVILTWFVYAVLAILFLLGAMGLLLQEQLSNGLISVVLLLFSIIGLIDTVNSRLHLTNKVITVLANKRMTRLRKQEQERIQVILGDMEQ